MEGTGACAVATHRVRDLDSSMENPGAGRRRASLIGGGEGYEGHGASFVASPRARGPSETSASRASGPKGTAQAEVGRPRDIAGREPEAPRERSRGVTGRSERSSRASEHRPVPTHRLVCTGQPAPRVPVRSPTEVRASVGVSVRRGTSASGSNGTARHSPDRTLLRQREIQRGTSNSGETWSRRKRGGTSDRPPRVLPGRRSNPGPREGGTAGGAGGVVTQRQRRRDLNLRRGMRGGPSGPGPRRNRPHGRERQRMTRSQPREPQIRFRLQHAGGRTRSKPSRWNRPRGRKEWWVWQPAAEPGGPKGSTGGAGRGRRRPEEGPEKDGRTRRGRGGASERKTDPAVLGRVPKVMQRGRR